MLCTVHLSSFNFYCWVCPTYYSCMWILYAYWITWYYCRLCHLDRCQGFHFLKIAIFLTYGWWSWDWILWFLATCCLAKLWWWSLVNIVWLKRLAMSLMFTPRYHNAVLWSLFSAHNFLRDLQWILMWWIIWWDDFYFCFHVFAYILTDKV